MSVKQGPMGRRKSASEGKRVRREMLIAGLAKFGLQKIEKRLPEWRKRDYFASARGHAIEGIPDERCFVLQNVIRALKDVPGDVAECGLRFGKSTAFMLEADPRKDRSWRLFDSFEGLSEPEAADALADTGKAHWGKSDLDVPEEIVRRDLQGFGQDLHFYKGWIPTRFPEVADRTFALLHVDVDLYRPTVDSLEFFWPRMVPGAVVVCDDYGSRKCPGAKQAFDEFFADKDARLIELPTVQALVFKPG
ncbi:TylF/MycF family methyltransferase [Chenggangzhangella methanolivorans]|uniref:TylF/MycF family methyltransferase n=1 Tax=Chenggangzhangella methanolivorans TaxID=1437009 RepID=A0A9E6UQG2_9HYPH|nr:TylF/MycF family methyltransferase [Chenggangzhangella methanolivorans]QZO00905.1 TylF/MycF family methyltransferase [Chenggangzhangella methanolivorans]